MQSVAKQHVTAPFQHVKPSFGKTRLRVATALAWAFWGANRRGWQLVLTTTCVCALLFRVFGGPIHDSENLRFLSCLPMVMSLILAAAFCNFTDRTRRDGIAGFPRHLFSLPVGTPLVVTCAFACGVLSVVSLYVVWATLIFQPIGVVFSVGWPATLIAVGVVFYQAIVWCLCGFRLTRIITLSLVATILVAAGFVPVLRSEANLRATDGFLFAVVGSMAVIAYGATLATVGAQRRGGARGWAWFQTFVDRLSRVVPQRRTRLKSADAALFWIEWHRAGLILPTAVLLTTGLMLSAIFWFSKKGPEATFRAESWLLIMPMLLAFPIGMGFGKPDFWSLELTLSPFVAARPVSGGQLTAAKMKAAACSTFVAWAALLLVAPPFIYIYCDTTHWHDVWHMLGLILSPFSRVLVPLLMLLLAMLLTWSLMIGRMWLGYSGRPWFYYSLVTIGMCGFFTLLGYFTWWQDHPHQRGNGLVMLLPWLPWVLASGIVVKIWAAVLCSRRMLQSRMISHRNLVVFVCTWLVAAACLVLFAWMLSRRVEWLRDTLILIGLLFLPTVRLAATPLAIAWNRHR